MSRGKRFFRVGTYALCLLVVLELGSRAYWRFAYDVPFASEPVDWYSVYYDGFRASGLAEDPPARGGERLDVLLLGGSTLDYLYRDRGEVLRQRLEAACGGPVRLYDFARPAHTTRDSLLKYRLLDGVDFDLVVLYDGINDARLNNAPAEMFRADYRHGSWYDRIEHMLADEPWDAALLFPHTLRLAWIKAIDSRRLSFYVPKHKPNPAWTVHGGEIKTSAPFRANVQAIADLAALRGQRLVLMTFAWYQPDDYTFERFEAKELDYADHQYATEIWGEPAHVARAMVEHDRVLRELPRPPHVLFVDVEAAIPKDALHFRDICHLTEAGECAWIEALATALADAEVAPEARAAGAVAR